MILALLLLQAVAPPAPVPPSPVPTAQAMATMMVEPVAALIASFDADMDGRTTRAELAAGTARSFAAIDAKPNASLSYIGWSDWAERWLGDRNALPSPFEVDADNDNRITAAELQAALARSFDRLDRDHDGAVTRAECLTIRAQVTDPRGRRGKRGGGDAPPSR